MGNYKDIWDMVRRVQLPVVLAVLVLLTACGRAEQETGRDREQSKQEVTADMKMTIGDTPVTVAWEDNASVDALKVLCADGPLTIGLHMYGGFEQVGDIGDDLPRDDAQTTTQAGDIVLYSGDQMVVFYGSNSWAYTRLGRITDQDADGMRRLLGGGDVTVTLTAG